MYIYVYIYTYVYVYVYVCVCACMQSGSMTSIHMILHTSVLYASVCHVEARVSSCHNKSCSIAGTLMPGKKKRDRLSRQAPALSQRQWKLWLEWLLNTAGPRIYFVIFLTGAFGLRCSEAIALKREDLIINGAIPKVRVTGDTAGARKSPGDVYIREQHLKKLKAHLAKGIVTADTKFCKHTA